MLIKNTYHDFLCLNLMNINEFEKEVYRNSLDRVFFVGGTVFFVAEVRIILWQLVTNIISWNGFLGDSVATR